MGKIYDLDTLLEEVVTLPSLPGSVAQVMRLVNDPQCDMVKLAQTISTDPSLALKTLRIVNSVMYGLRTKVAQIDQAVMLLGMKVIKNLAFTATVFELMKGSVEAVFRHSLACAVAMRTLADTGIHNTSLESPEEAFTCGLLHDIGKVLLVDNLPEECQQAADLARQQGVPIHLAEIAVIGVDHAQVGARLAEQWKLPAHVINAIAGHHDLGQCPDKGAVRLPALVAVADFMCYSAGIAPEGVARAMDDEVWAATGFKGQDMLAIMDCFFEGLPIVNELMQLAD